EWWNANVEDVIAEAIQRGAQPNSSNAFTINSQPGDFFACSKNDTTRILIEAGKTYLLRIVNAAMNHPFFFKIAQHNMTVVAVDAVYTKQYEIDVLLIQPGNTMDVLLTASQQSGLYYMGARIVDEEMLITEGFGVISCPNNSCAGLRGSRPVGSFNNISFVRLDIAILKAYYFGIDGEFTREFPDNPPLVFDYTGNVLTSLWEPKSETRVKVLKFNSSVQIVFQNTGILTIENHPLHLHGQDFYVVGQGFGNYNSQTDPSNFNLVDPQMLNTVGVPTGGWAAIRFKAENPGAWLLHCHFESHSELGFDM
ncbi:hypothetical protein KI387_001047, partial [Taxus chinensis]